MLDKIGFIAGDIYSILEKDGPQTMYSLKKALDNTKDLVPMGIGWLAREDKITFLDTGKTLKISIK
ncbi:MAG: hypothetical protein A2161_11245 [Candidatus Schekmanbacteria bacterium RBG_13_48_7]|uniref:Winged helix-turn-helix domain-containing protein n=1 Tax=Candidatus Schekmanbacteria bacterium RBG_13_48_7 TaxID=1817878 RepID=A0A1F7RSB2_9BACT|nr:MAG: hypothetical protein A2161_11245 [Candidatus Schekmanbacteria bacterium RBG_13_48_7]